MIYSMLQRYNTLLGMHSMHAPRCVLTIFDAIVNHFHVIA